MNRYICTSCGRFSYSAAPPETLRDDSCIYSGCDGRIVLQKCRVCGCTWNKPCPGGCFWAEEDLCSRCAERGTVKMAESEKGLYDKYTVLKNETGEPIDGPAFILRPDRDPAAVAALTAYAKTTDNKQLAGDILRWIKPDVKLDTLNAMEVIEASCDGNECVYVLAYSTEENVNALLSAGFTAEQIKDATDAGAIDLAQLAFQHTAAEWWQAGIGFTVLKGADDAD